MPWARNADLPEAVRNALPEAAQTRFRIVANSAFERKAPEQAAIRQAWSVVKQGWNKDKDGKWVRKSALEIEKAKPRSLYVYRQLKNAKELASWAKEQGFSTTLPLEDMHVTIAYSKSPVDWMSIQATTSFAAPIGDDKVIPGDLLVPAGGPRLVEPLGDKGAVVLLFANQELAWRHNQIKEKGASWDFPGYQPHITISWDAADVNLDEVEPYNGPLEFGPECFEEIDESWKDNLVEKAGSQVLKRMVGVLEQVHTSTYSHRELFNAKVSKLAETSDEFFTVAKVDSDLGLVFGWAIVCKHNGEDYYDLNRDPDGERVPEHIPERSMLEASTDFMQNSRVAKEMHVGDEKGSIVFAFPLTTEIAKAMGIQTSTTGLMIAMKPSSSELLGKFRDGKLKGFSIGGKRLKCEDLAGG